MTTASDHAEPVVSVLISARDAMPFLGDALESLRRQTMPRFEVIAVDDGSTDGTRQILDAVAQRDPRFRIIANEVNIGLAASLNRAIEWARAPLLARLDADDIAEPDRLAEQVRCFDADPSLVLLGSNVHYVDERGRPIERSAFPCDDWTIRCCALLFNPFAHPSVMMRARPFRESGVRYDPSFETTQDWELWTRLMAHGTVANLEPCLVRLRLSSGSVSARKKPIQLDNSLRIQQRYIRQFLGTSELSTADLTLLSKGFLGDRSGADREGWDRIRACLLALDILARADALTHGRRTAGFQRYIINRSVRMGLVPPLKRGWTTLLWSLLRQAPGETARSVGRHLLAWSRGHRPA